MDRYRKVFHASPSPMALFSREAGAFVEVNRAFVALTGFTTEEALGRDAVELGLLTPDVRDRVRERLAREGHFRFMEVTVGTRSGPMPALISGEVLELDDGPHLLFVGTDITDQKSAEDLLRFTQFSVDRAAVQVFWVSPEGRITYANDLACETLGYGQAELEALWIHEVDAEMTGDSWLTFWERLRSEGSARFLTRHRDADGNLYPVDVAANYLRVADRETAVGFVRDLRDLQEVRDALQETETKFRTIFEQGVELMGVLDLEGTLLDVNDAALRMVGAKKENLVGRPFWETPWWDHSEELKRDLIGWIRRAREGEQVVLEAQHPDSEGGWRTVEASIAPIRDARGPTRYLLAVGHDVTDRVRATQALQESEERYESLVANIPDVTWITEENGRTAFVSPNVLEVLGYSEEEVCDPMGGLWFSGVHPADVEKVRASFEKLFSAGEAFDLEYRFRRKDGRWVWLRDRAMRTFEEDGLRFAYGVFSDVTQRKNLEVQLQQAQKLDTLGTLASGIAHDFNNLLVPLLGYSDLLREGVEVDDPLRQELEVHVFDAVDRARELVRQILTFSRKEEPERRPIHLAGPLKGALRLVAVTLPSSITLRRRLTEGGGRVMADGNQLQQVVLNFCTNAVHAMREQGGVLEVTLEETTLDPEFRYRHPDFGGDRAAVIAVRDTGEGMETEVLERVFDPFFTTKSPGEGTGLGLSIAYGIVKTHGGVLEVESRPGAGTTFRVFLPLVEDPELLPGAGELAEARGSESVLFVDDQEATRETGKRLLASLGYQAVAAGGGREALELVRQNPRGFDVVVSDYDMPEMTGTHLALELREIRRDLPVVLVTGSHPARIMEGVGLGVQASLMKPFTAGELGRAVRRALDLQDEAEGGGETLS